MVEEMVFFENIDICWRWKKWISVWLHV